MTETEEALAIALVDGFNRVTDPDARQEKFTAEDFEIHVRFLVPVVERVIALRKVEARLDESMRNHAEWERLTAEGAPGKHKTGEMATTVVHCVICVRIAELERQRDALLNREEASYEQAQS